MKALAALRLRWRALTPRERRAAVVAMAVVALALSWFVAVQPAWRTLREAPARLDALDAQLEQMQRLAAEAAALRATPPLAAGQAAQALQAATERLGERGRLTLQGDRATVTLLGVDGEQLRQWLGEARAGARARPLEAQLSRGPQGYTGSVVLALGGGG